MNKACPKTKEELVAIIKQTIDKEGWNCDLNFIDTSYINDMSKLFAHANDDDDDGYGLSQFNGEISEWDVSNVMDMSCMFWGSQFNGDISKWDVANVKDMSIMFAESQFNGDISKWDVRRVENMSSMFCYSVFNGNISKWNVGKAIKMDSMFCNSKFNGDISKWKLNRYAEEDLDDMFDGCDIPERHKPRRFEDEDDGFAREGYHTYFSLHITGPDQDKIRAIFDSKSSADSVVRALRAGHNVLMASYWDVADMLEFARISRTFDLDDGGFGVIIESLDYSVLIFMRKLLKKLYDVKVNVVSNEIPDDKMQEYLSTYF